MRGAVASVALLGLGALAACQPAPPTAAPDPGTCPPPGIAALVGQSDAVLKTMRFDRPTRIIRPGMAVTMDYSPDRVNIEIDETGTITGVRCY